MRAAHEVQSFHAVRADEAGAPAVEAYRHDGVIVLREAFAPPWLDLLERGAARVMERSRRDGAFVIGHPGEPGKFFYDSLMWPEIDEFRCFIFDSNAPDLFRSVLRSERLVFYYDFLLVKGPGSRRARTPWHQDHSYYPLNGHQVINCWTALDEIPRETALRFVRGSHRTQPLHQAVHFAPGKRYRNLITERPVPPDFDAFEGEHEILSTAMSPGDTLVWNSRMFHAAPGNPRPVRRAAFSTNWLGDDVTYHDIAQQTDPAARGEKLVHGGPVECATFPRVR